MVRIERQFDADLKARFVGGAARELARNKLRAAGAVSDSIFDGKNRAAAEAAVELREMSQHQRKKRREADAEANAARLNDEHEFRDGEGMNDNAIAEELPDAAPAGGNADYRPMIKTILRTIGETPAEQDEDEEEAVVDEATLPESERAASSAARRAIQAEDKLTADELPTRRASGSSPLSPFKRASTTTPTTRTTRRCTSTRACARATGPRPRPSCTSAA